MTDQHELLPAAAAARYLGVKPATLYAYVSRGLLRSAPHGEGRERRYPRADLERLKGRRIDRATETGRVPGILRWGEPILESSITAIEPSGPAYRGRPAVDLARMGTAFESVAELLWSGELPPGRPAWRADGEGAPLPPLATLLPAGSSRLAALALVVPAIAAGDPGRFSTEPSAVTARARPLILRLAASLALPENPARVERALRAGGVARAVAMAVRGTRDRDAAALIDRALVLVADHELNVSAFAARVAASAGADLHACVSAALAALSGPRHGGHLERVEALVAESGSPSRASQAVHERFRRGESVPGFGHPFYPDGDPRAVPLLQAARGLASKVPAVRTLLAIVDVMREAGRLPTIDTALVAVSLALGLPPGSAVALFAVGRAAGWTAHVLEQYEAGYLIRPRALYRGRRDPIDNPRSRIQT